MRRTTAPSPSTLRVDGSLLEMERGGKTEQLDLDAAPAIRPFVDAFAAILRGDLAALEASFSVELVPAKDGAWELALTPSRKPMAKVIREIRLAGRGVSLSRLVVRETNGDESVTTFTKVNAAHAHTPAELASLRSGAGK